MRVRRAQQKDLKAIVGVDGLALTDRERRRWIGRAIREGAVHILEDGGTVVGYTILTRCFFQRPFLEMLVVRAGDRRRGLGVRLLKHAESIGRKAGALWTSTNQSNVPMRRFLTKQGFAVAGSVSGLDQDDPEIFYVKKAEQVARANAGNCHAACYRTEFRMKSSTGNRKAARGVPAPVVAHL